MLPLRGVILAVSRRNFLQNGVLAAAGCFATPVLALSQNRPIGGDGQLRELPTRPLPSGSGDWQQHAAALNHMDRNLFSSAVGTAFRVALLNAPPVWVTLLSVEDLPSIAASNPASFAVRNKKSFVAPPTTSGFVLRFGSSALLSQETYLFEHSELGSFALFTVPAAGGQGYIAVINRLDSPSIIAVPRGPTATAQTTGSAGAPALGITAAPAISSGVGSPLPALDRSPAVRRAVTRD